MKRKIFIGSISVWKKVVSAVLLLLASTLVLQLGKGGLTADFVEQDGWHLIRADVVPEGIEVETAGENLMLHSGVKVRADSIENREFSADMVRDGINDSTIRRWSSANDWENNEHWLEITFPQEETVGLLRIYWERTNVCSYALEYSSDRKNWTAAAEFYECPEGKIQDIYLDVPVSARYLRLHVTGVSKEEADLSLYYQNVSVLELEVYEGIKDNFLIRKPDIPEENRRQLVEKELSADEPYREYANAVLYPEVPKGYSLKFVGSDYDMLVEADGKISDTIADTKVELGFALEKDNVRYELPGMEVVIPPAQGKENDPDMEEGLPEGYSVMEWEPHVGTYRLTEKTRVVISKAHEEELFLTATLFAQELSALLERNVEVVIADDSRTQCYDMEPDDIYLSFRQDYEAETEGKSWIDGMGEEGYQLCLQSAVNGGTQILGTTAQGVRWGCVSMLSLWERTQGGELPKGVIRDYPRYSVRGFGIDVGRRAVSMELLYDIMKEMSKQKMNTLIVHLNDNQIIAQSDYDGTVEGARELYAGFRLESDLKNEEGMGITAADYFYTKEEFARFIADAAVYGVEIVPEIDTPAHSLFLTRVFPKLGLSGNPESADQLDLSKPETVELVKTLWSEYLDDSLETAVFSACNAVHIGMDEYYGDEGEYISYLTELSNYIGTIAPDKKIHIWGSFSKIRAERPDELRNLQMHIWSTDWADPMDMYDEGFRVINSLSSNLYIIPGGGYDWLDQEFLEEKWQPNIFETQERTWILPAYSPRMLGAAYMLWNDWYQLTGESITDEDMFERFVRPLPVIAHKLWGDWAA